MKQSNQQKTHVVRYAEGRRDSLVTTNQNGELISATQIQLSGCASWDQRLGSSNNSQKPIIPIPVGATDSWKRINDGHGKTDIWTEAHVIPVQPKCREIWLEHDRSKANRTKGDL